MYTQWQGVTVVQGTYRDPVPVEGVNDIGQFQPFIDSMNVTLWSWYADTFMVQSHINEFTMPLMF